MTNEIKLKPRKHPVLWQAYKAWYEWSELRKRHLLRMSAIERGASSYSMTFETQVMDAMNADGMLKYFEKVLHEEGEKVGPIYDWLCDIRGISGQLAGKLLALIDDIGESPTVSALWRFSGYAVIDGKRERPVKGEKLHYNKSLKSVVWQVTDSFVKQNTPYYRDYYDATKAEYYLRYPEPLCTECGTIAAECLNKVGHKGVRKYTPGHIDAMTRRKVSKRFLSHLWAKWREYEGLPVSDPYIFAIGGHSVEHMVTTP